MPPVADEQFSDPSHDKGTRYPFRKSASGEMSYFIARMLTDTELQAISVAVNGITNKVTLRGAGVVEQSFNTLKFRLEQRHRALRSLIDFENVGVRIGDEDVLRSDAPFFPGEALVVGAVVVLDGKLKRMAEATIDEGVRPDGTPIKATRMMTLAEFYLSSRGQVCDDITEAWAARKKEERATEEGKETT